MIMFCLLANFIHAQVSFGVQAGVSLASYKASNEGVSATSKTKAGFSGGFVASIDISNGLSFRPELNFLQKGGTVKENDVTDKLTLNYLELPLNFTYHVKLGEGKLFFGLGPVLAYGLSGTDKNSENPEDYKIKFGNSDDADLKPLEIGGNVLAGYQLGNGLFLAANYNFGLNNISPASDIKDHNRYFGIRLGFMFETKKAK